MLKIHSIETFWTHEWPWIRFILFLQWCNFSCLYCHNADTIPLSKKWKKIKLEEVFKKIENSKIYFGKKGWITISGWECLLQAKELIPFLKELKKRWFNIVIDTNWSILNDDVKILLNYVDLVLLDIKQIDDKKHQELTWKSNKKVLEFVRYLEKINKKFWIRYVLVPWYTDNKKNIEKMWEFLKDFKNLEKIEILPYHTLWVFKWQEIWIEYKLKWALPPSDESKKEIKKILEKYVENVFVRG